MAEVIEQNQLLACLGILQTDPAGPALVGSGRHAHRASFS